MSKYDLGIQELAHQSGVLVDAIKLLHRNENVATSRMDDVTRANTVALAHELSEQVKDLLSRLDPEYTLNLQVFGCCSVDYLTDHLNGDEEELISLPVILMSQLDIESLLIDEVSCNKKYGYITETTLSKLVSAVSGDAWHVLAVTLGAIDGDESAWDDLRLWFALTW